MNSPTVWGEKRPDDVPAPRAGDTGMEVPMHEQGTPVESNIDYVDGHDQGWEEADDFIERHPQGMPWSALPEQDEEDEEDEEDQEDISAHERGRRAGWTERMRQEGWPLSRREARGG
jgi:hypothetical protein